MANYFENFPLTTYANTVVIDITRRGRFNETVHTSPFVLQSYTLQDGQRADHIAKSYYDDEGRDWIVYLSNEIIDPYHGWYKSTDAFVEWMKEKYGSIANSQTYVSHWQTNWWDVHQDISVDDYYALDGAVKRFYEPRIDPSNGAEISFYRREEDWVINTNQILTLTFANTTFTKGEKVEFSSNSAITGNAEVIFSNSTVTRVQHVIPVALANTGPGVSVYGTISSNTGTIVTREYTANTIPVNERDYYVPLSIFDVEFEKNEKLRKIRLIDKIYTSDVEIDFAKLIKGSSSI